VDALYFLNERTAFIRFFYVESAKGFADVKHCIEEGLPPFDAPPYSENPEPPYLNEWLDADAALNVLGIACISMLSDTLKLYFKALQERVIGFTFQQRSTGFKNGYVRTYLAALGDILDTDWSDCPADLDVIEQIVLARNRGQHGEHLSSFTFTHDRSTLAKHPRPFFAAEDELSALTSEGGSLASFLMPSLKVDRERLHRAIAELERFAEWIDSRLDRAREWRMAGR
jgi:hypothetical protein